MSQPPAESGMRRAPEPLRMRVGVVAFLTLYLVLLYGIPARYVVGPIGGIGTPAVLTGFLAAFWWVTAHVLPYEGPARGPQPVRVGVLAYVWFMLLTYAIAFLRPLSGTEGGNATRTTLILLSATGITLLVADGLDGRRPLDTLLKHLVAAGAFLASAGIITFLTGVNVAEYLQIPGLELNRELTVATRSLFNRPTGTALHPIEFSVVLSMILPLALHYFLTTERGPSKWRAGAALGLMLCAIPMGVSRSGILGLLVGVGVLSCAWGWRRRLNAAVVGVGVAGLMWAAIPGLVGTLRGLFTGWSDDPSIASRTGDVPRVMELVVQAPWFGRGFGTFSHIDYFLLDNQYLKTAIESGLIGVFALVLMLLTAIWTALSAGRRSADERARHLGWALAASVAVAMVSIATFDAFYYRIFTGTLFLVMGAAGAYWRLTPSPDLESEEAAREDPAGTLRGVGELMPRVG